MLEIAKDKLICGKEYYLEAIHIDNNNNNIIRSNPPYKMIAKFCKLDILDNKYLICHFNNFRRIRYKNIKNFGYDVELNNFWKFYEIIENKIQTQMENRALEMIFEKTVKDQYFFNIIL